ncbi:MAG: transglutaminase domain-containing protein [Magnetococcales bacterium]|nr:transglutaminase domain-containing protein [Magnetococcales bacterium]
MKRVFGILSLLAFLATGVPSAWAAKGIVTMTIEPTTSGQMATSQVWLPYPISGPFQKIHDIDIQDNATTSAVYGDPDNGATHLYAEWRDHTPGQRLVLQFLADTRERRVEKLVDKGLPVPAEIEKYLQPNHWLPTDGAVGKTAGEIASGRKGILEKARAVYDWVVENTTRDPNVRGCGLGIVEATMSQRSGKCADLSSVYVALARAIGVPSREVFGLRLGKKPEQDITGGYHCWAEFYLPGTGWVPVDPSDVRKIMLVNKLTLEQVKAEREYYFGAVDDVRITLRHGGRGLTLTPPQNAGPINYLMYPYAEVNGKALDYFDPKTFRYTVHFKAVN